MNERFFNVAVNGANIVLVQATNCRCEFLTTPDYDGGLSASSRFRKWRFAPLNTRRINLRYQSPAVAKRIIANNAVLEYLPI